MSREFKVKKRYYEQRIIYKKNSIEIESGITVLIGCNGAGKSTLQHIMMNSLKEEHIDFLYFDNMLHGGHNMMDKLNFEGKTDEILYRAFASEGENIRMNIGECVKGIAKYIDKGLTDNTEKFLSLASIFSDDDKVKKEVKTTKERWLFFDAIDSGYSIDNVMDIKELFHIILNDFKDFDIYIVVTANEYEMCIDEPCFNVIDGKYVYPKSYDEYKKIILKTREYKNKQETKYYLDE
jgi:Fe-S cluster assembly ATPase SufC